MLQMIWVCILCRKKQELLIKTGQWIHSSMASRLQQLEAETPLETPTTLIGGVFDKKPRLERTFSAEKENQLYMHTYHTRRGSLGLPSRQPSQEKALRRQYSHDAAPSCSTWSDRRFVSEADRRLLPVVPPPSTTGSSHQYMQRAMPEVPDRGRRMKPATESELALTIVESGIGSDTAGSGKKLPRQGSRDLSRVENLGWSSMESGTGTMPPGMVTGYESGPERGTGRRLLTHQNLSLGAAPSGLSQSFAASGSAMMPLDQHGVQPYATLTYPSSNVKRQLFSSNGGARSRSSGLLDPSSARLAAASRREAFLRNESLSSDQSEHVAQPPRPHRTRVKREKLRQQFSLSSSEEELRSTPEFAEDDFYYQSLGEQSGLKCQKSLKREEILDAKIKRFLAVSKCARELPLESRRVEIETRRSCISRTARCDAKASKACSSCLAARKAHLQTSDSVRQFAVAHLSICRCILYFWLAHFPSRLVSSPSHGLSFCPPPPPPNPRNPSTPSTSTSFCSHLFRSETRTPRTARTHLRAPRLVLVLTCLVFSFSTHAIIDIISVICRPLVIVICIASSSTLVALPCITLHNTAAPHHLEALH